MLIPAALVFFLSGFAALVYQVTWQRMLVIFSGADVYSATVVIAVFMAGLGCGTLAGGHLADRVPRVRSLALFVAAEAGIAVFGFASTYILYDVLYGRFGHLAARPAVMAALLFASLLWPTFLMGSSLPLLSRALVRDTGTAAATIGWLYAGNTLGAAAGALVATWGLLPARGMEGTLDVAATLNLVCAAAAVPLAWRLRSRADRPDRVPMPEAAATPAPARAFSVAQWTWLYALSGFIALSLEIVWFRLLGVMLKSTSVTFGTLLAQYLLWLGLGSAAGSLAARRATAPARTFLWLQIAATAYAALAVAVFVALLPEAGRLRALYGYFSGFDPVPLDPSTRAFLRLYVALPAFLIGPATWLMGFSFPFLQRAVQTDLAYLGRRVGTLLVGNIAGSTAGTMVTGWLLLGVAGTPATIRILAGCSVVFALAAWRLSSPPTWTTAARYAASAAAIGTALVTLPDGRALWAVLHGAAPGTVIAAEDGSGVSLVKGRSRDFSGEVVVFVNGVGQSWLPYGGIHSELGALPAMIHPEPREAAVIGLGSGDTLFAVGGRRELRRITSIEIIRPQIDTLRALVPLYPYPALTGWLADARIEHVFDDGRAYLRDRGATFDILEADALRPTSAYAGNLYSDAYFALLRTHLRPGGLAVTWVPTPRVERTFLRVFPYAVGFGDILMGSNQPIRIDADAVQRRLADPGVQAYYAQAGINIRELLEPRLRTATRYALSPAERSQITDINTDLYPRDEFGR